MKLSKGPVIILLGLLLAIYLLAFSVLVPPGSPLAPGAVLAAGIR